MNHDREWPAALAQAAVAATSNLLIVLEPDDHLSLANPAAIETLALNDAAARRWADLLDLGSRTKGRLLVEQIRERGTSDRFELNLQTANGDVIMSTWQGHLQPDGTILLIGQSLAPTVDATERLVALNRRLQTLFQAAATASQSLVLADMLTRVVRATCVELDLQAGGVWLLADAGKQEAAASTSLVASYGFVPRFAKQMARSSWIQRWTAGLPMAGVTVVDDQELGIEPDDLSAPGLTPFLRLAAVPLRGEDRMLGWLLLFSDRYQAFRAGEIEVLDAVGQLLATPIQNGQLFEALAETSGQLQAVLDGIDSGVLLIDEQGIVRYANQRLGSLLGQPVANWPGEPRSQVFPRLIPHQRAEDEVLGELWQSPEIPDQVLRRWQAPVHDRDGALLGTIEVYSDVTAIESLNRLKDDFVAAAAHDLKTPLTGIKGYAQIAVRLARRGTDDRLIHQLEMINTRTNELTYLIDSLLDMSRIQAGRLALELSTFPLVKLLHQAVGAFDFDLQRRKRTIDLVESAAEIEVHWDLQRMVRVVMNLLSNALKYSPEGGPVEVVAAKLGDDQVELTVTDHGIGIPPEDRPHVFERFFRVAAAVSHGFRGTGLGLYICQQIVMLHGGTITAEAARHGGQGTTIRIVLPMAVPAED